MILSARQPNSLEKWGFTRTMGDDEVKSLCKLKKRDNHPDINKEDPDAKEKFNEISTRKQGDHQCARESKLKNREMSLTDWANLLRNTSPLPSNSLNNPVTLASSSLFQTTFLGFLFPSFISIILQGFTLILAISCSEIASSELHSSVRI